MPIMKGANFHIRKLESAEIHLLKDFPPEQWHFDFPAFLSLHMGYTYFKAIVATVKGQIVGVGHAIIHPPAAWLGNIIVLPEFRNRGIGSAITRELIGICRARGCRSLLLISTQQGQNIYQKLGFKVSTHYIFYQTGQKFKSITDDSINQMSSEDLTDIFRLDRLITGENRSELIARFCQTGWLYRDTKTASMAGFYLPDLGNGLIIADNDTAGLALLRFSIQTQAKTTVVPEENSSARHFLLERDYREVQALPRMILGEEVVWKPQNIYSRGSGYCG
jgi:ribosomal protein S18 acetylase RimI-like enzyme